MPGLNPGSYISDQFHDMAILDALRPEASDADLNLDFPSLVALEDRSTEQVEMKRGVPDRLLREVHLSTHRRGRQTLGVLQRVAGEGQVKTRTKDKDQRVEVVFLAIRLSASVRRHWDRSDFEVEEQLFAVLLDLEGGIAEGVGDSSHRIKFFGGQVLQDEGDDLWHANCIMMRFSDGQLPGLLQTKSSLDDLLGAGEKVGRSVSIVDNLRTSLRASRGSSHIDCVMGFLKRRVVQNSSLGAWDGVSI
jgi:hypothetical protein